MGKGDVVEHSMFGGRCFMLDGNMLACAGKGRMLFRIGMANFDEALQREGTRPMVQNGGIMRGFIFVDEQQLQSDDEFGYWMTFCLNYNQSLPPRTANT